MSRPEHKAPPQIYYNKEEAIKYGNNSRILEIQGQLAERAYELLAIPEGMKCMLLDLGCGSGLSGEVLSSYGHSWIGIDISAYMLDVALQRDVEGDLVLGDLGEGLSFRTGSFDGAISVSALQWLCNADASDHIPAKRLKLLFDTLYQALSRGSRAVFQFYPENEIQIDLITRQAIKAGFSGGVVIDYPESSKAKKYYLCLMCGGSSDHTIVAPPAHPDSPGENTIQYTQLEDHYARKTNRRKKKGKPKKGSREWIVNKKETQRKRGLEVRPDSKYTGRRRKAKF